MAIKPIEWDALTEAEKWALAAAGETSPLAFTSLWFNITNLETFRTNWHHHYFNWAAEKVLSGDVQNLIVNIPPSGTKTEFWSIHLPVYAMVKYPRVRILNTSYSGSLADENSTRARSLVRSSEFQTFYPYEIGKDKVNDWTLEQNGKRLHQLSSRSSGGQITGVRGGYMGEGYTGHIQADDWDKVDDLFSETKRKKSHTRLTNTLRSRRAHSGTPFIFVQQRCHVDDSTAFLLRGGMGLNIDLHIKIPALIDQEYIDGLPDGIRERCIKDVCDSKQVNGKWSYWPDKENIDDLVELSKAHPYTFTSQYQQNPETLEGGVFESDDFVYYGNTDDGADIPEPPKYEYRFITADTAQKTNNWNDWTVFAEWGVWAGKLYLLSIDRDRMDAKALRRRFETFVKAAHAKNSGIMGNLRYVDVEDKSSGTGLIQEMEGRLPVKVTAVPRERDKLTRAMDCAPHHSEGKVALPYGSAANFEFVSEVAGFTHDDSHKHDDQADVMMDAIDRAFIRQHKGKKKRAGTF